MRNAVGISPKQGLLSGLRSNTTAGQVAKGQAMSAASNASMNQQQQNQQFGLQQMQQESQLRQQQAANNQRAQVNRTQEQTQQLGMESRNRAFDTGLRYDYAQLRKRQGMAWKQAALNAFARDM